LHTTFTQLAHLWQFHRGRSRRQLFRIECEFRAVGAAVLRQPC
jgi:hypothetical protein